MLIARAPVRISFAGGGTDVPDYYHQFGGTVLSTSIDKYFYVIVNYVGSGATQIISADYKTLFSLDHRNGYETDLIWAGDLALPKAVLAHFGLDRGQSIFLSCEVPPGTGLGSSSAATVCLIKAFATYRGQEINKQETAELASYIEIEKMGMPIGKQDQYASAFGGLNQFDFQSDGTVKVTPLRLPQSTMDNLQEWLMLFYTGISRHSTSILEKQKASMKREEKEVLDNLHALKELVKATRASLEGGDLPTFGALLDEGWQRKKRLATNVSSEAINETYEVARAAGAIGGKITGAGGGGFLLLCCPPEHKTAVAAAMSARGLNQMYFRLESRGAHVVLDNLG